MRPSRTRLRSTGRAAGPAELLLEIGVEELPYQFIDPALSALRDAAARLLEAARLSSGTICAYGTPRRLVLVVEDLARHQTPLTKETMGPSKTVAFDQDGQPTRAAIGFAASHGLPVKSLHVRQTHLLGPEFGVDEEDFRVELNIG